MNKCSSNTVWLCITTRYRGGATITERLWDGKRTYEIRSDAFDAQGRRVETVVTMPSDAPAVTNAVTVYDHLGRVVSVATPLGVTSNFYDGASSRLTRVSRTGSPDTLYAYDAFGDLCATALDVDGDGQISYAGPDRITATHETYEQDASNIWWRVTSQAVWAETNSAACITSSVTRVRLTGLGTPAPAALELSGGAILTAQTETLDRHGSVTHVSTYTDAGAAAVWTVTETPGSVQPAIQKTVAGRTVSVVSSTAVTNAYTFDGFGRQVSVTDGRGNTSVTAYNALGQVAYTEDAASNRTSYAYDGFGRQIAITDPLTNTTHTAYDRAGNVTAQWGATYPVAYTYDTAGRRTSMRTFRDENDDGDETRWEYDHATGLLTNKVYADGSCVRYAYTPSGLLASRVWSRGITASYAYDALGQLTNVHYSGNTPDVSFAYDRLGRMVSAITAVSSHLFEYAGLDLAGEIQDGVAITRSYDGLGRSTGFNIGDTYSTAYGYDDFGRFHSVSSSVCSVCSVVNYSCLPGSDLVSGYTAGPLAVTKTYEPARDLIAAVSNHVNHVNPVLISAYDYANDSAGRRVSRNADSFGYNARSEVIGAVIGTNSYGYAYDAIGNRRWFARRPRQRQCVVLPALRQQRQRHGLRGRGGQYPRPLRILALR